MISQRYNQSELVKGFLLQEKHKQMMRNWGTYSGSRLSTADQVGVPRPVNLRIEDAKVTGHRDASINSDHHVTLHDQTKESCSVQRPKKSNFRSFWVSFNHPFVEWSTHKKNNWLRKIVGLKHIFSRGHQRTDITWMSTGQRESLADGDCQNPGSKLQVIAGWTFTLLKLHL